MSTKLTKKFIKIFTLLSFSIFLVALFSSNTLAQTGDPLRKLADELSANYKDNKKIFLAVLPFKHSDQNLSQNFSQNLSERVQERLTTYMANALLFDVVERSLLNTLLKEKELELTGLLQNDSPKIGTLLGVDAVLLGVINKVNSKTAEINARIVDSQTGKILSAAVAQIDVEQNSVVTTPENNFLGKPLVQIAILLDTSSSMDGLISQTRSLLWKVINDLAGAEKNNDRPALQVALYEYGNDSLPREKGFIRQVAPFSSDLDVISEKLFALKTNGGLEYAGIVIDAAVKQLSWAKQDDVYKTIFIAGNEPFTQGPVDFRSAVSGAAQKGIIVNTIFCGQRQQGIATQWKAAADLSGGDFISIDQNQSVAVVSTPQDSTIANLGQQLNQTFIPYGEHGSVAYERQKKEDSNAQKNSAAKADVDRTVYKAQEQYSQGATQWDLTSQIMQGKMKITDIKKENLPDNLKKMSQGELTKYIEQQIQKRREIQAQIQKLHDQRRKFIAEAEKKSSNSPSTIDQAMQNSIRKQAEKKNFRFNNSR